MFNIKGDKTPLQITTSIKEYAESLTPGYHLAWTSTGADIDVVGQPVANTGFMYEIVNFGGTPIQIIAIPFFGSNNIYLLRKHGQTWRPWVEFVGNLLGGGNKCLPLPVKGGGVNDCYLRTNTAGDYSGEFRHAHSRALSLHSDKSKRLVRQGNSRTSRRQRTYISKALAQYRMVSLDRGISLLREGVAA